ncbi:hypothetical protein BHE74_00002474 [Ensete ventricosum]|nr:hypothetical protein BHE74_00002474 [Ensete ventricosum]
MSTAVSSEEKEHLTGIYDLVAVLTHKGRSADSGHYVAWVKQENGLSSRLKRFLCMHFGHSFRLITADDAGKWIQYDDDNPIPQREEDITKLSGGVGHRAILDLVDSSSFSMGSEQDGILSSNNVSAGGLVWVRRPNGSWWPGRVVGLDELPAKCVLPPRSGTPIKLLGREDGSM